MVEELSNYELIKLFEKCNSCFNQLVDYWENSYNVKITRWKINSEYFFRWLNKKRY